MSEDRQRRGTVDDRERHRVLDYFQRNRHFIGYVIGIGGLLIGLWTVGHLTLQVRDDQRQIASQTRLIENQQQALRRQQQALKREAQLGLQTFHATCAFRADLIRRARAGVAFLASHPNGIPGISAGTLAQSIHNQQLTIKSLQGLRCKGQAS